MYSLIFVASPGVHRGGGAAEGTGSLLVCQQGPVLGWGVLGASWGPPGVLLGGLLLASCWLPAASSVALAVSPMSSGCLAGCLGGCFPPAGPLRRPANVVGLGHFGEGVAAAAEEALLGPLPDRLCLGPASEAPDDGVLAALGCALCRRLAAPRRGGHRAVCLLVHQGVGPAGGAGAEGLVAEVAADVEGPEQGDGCAAEAAALSRLLLQQGGCSPLAGVERLLVASDGPHRPRVAGDLLAEHLGGDVPVVLAWCEAVQGGRRIRSQRAALGELFPLPCPYRGLERREIAGFARRLAARCDAVPHDAAPAKRLFEVARSAAAASPGPEELPRYAAAALFRSGEVRVCAASPASPSEPRPLVDAVLRLSAALEERALAGEAPELLLLCDQWGVLHAPGAAARGYLAAAGFADAPCLAHDAETGRLRESALSLSLYIYIYIYICIHMYI